VLRVRSLGTVPYHEADALQHALVQSEYDYLLVLQHPHVYTLGAHADASHVLVDPATVGARLERADRGGDVTYHGPGQLVSYPILTVPDVPSAGPDHVHRLEDILVDTLADLGLTGCSSDPEYPGVWVAAGSAQPRKIAAIGVRTLRSGPGRRRTVHGIALNVDCDLAMFGHIVPCGIADRGVTSLHAEGVCASMDQVVDAFVARAVQAFGPSGYDRYDVMSGATAASADSTERPLLRRLRQAGVTPEAGLAVTERKPPWARVPVRIGKGYRTLGATIHDLGLVTVCEEAGCPNIYECWADGTATFMINGERCTRACGFCRVDTRRPLPLAPDEPDRVAQAVERMRLEHAVVTCVARDDLADGGAGAMAATILAIRQRTPVTTVEVLIADCKGDREALDAIFEARPDVLNHNIETVARLQRAVRPSAGYARSLAVLARAAAAGLVTKSGLMVGLGEREDEVVATMADLRAIGVSIVTVGQYLRPSREHLPVARYWTPQEFEAIRAEGAALGIPHVEASPLTRSSYHAREAVAAAADSVVRPASA
jgi:lipoyl synthase